MLNGRLVGEFYTFNKIGYQCIGKLGDCTAALTLAITHMIVGGINNPVMSTLMLLSNFNFIFHFPFSHLYLMKILNFPNKIFTYSLLEKEKTNVVPSDSRLRSRIAA